MNQRIPNIVIRLSVIKRGGGPFMLKIAWDKQDWTIWWVPVISCIPKDLILVEFMYQI